MPFELWVGGGSLGEWGHQKTKIISGKRYRFYSKFENKVDAVRMGRHYVKSFSGGYKNYYKPIFRVVKA